jgi:hypothetical protein
VKKRGSFLCVWVADTQPLCISFFFSSIWWMQNTINVWSIPRSDLYVRFPLVTSFQMICPPQGVFFYGEELLDHRSTPSLEDHPLSAECNYLLNKFVATPHVYRLSPLSAIWGRARSRWPRAYEAYKCTRLVNYISCKIASRCRYPCMGMGGFRVWAQ